jgi:hypothetical protein
MNMQKFTKVPQAPNIPLPMGHFIRKFRKSKIAAAIGLIVVFPLII